MRKAVINGSTVENVIEAGDGFAIPDRTLVAVPDGSPVSAGWSYAKGAFAPPAAPCPTMDAIMAERDRRIEAGFPFMGKMIQSRPEDRENIAGAKSAAQDAKLLGAEPGDYGWQKKLDPDGGAATFAWITADNSLLPLDADQVIALGYAAMFHKQAMIFAAWRIKQRIDAGEAVGDVTADALWG